MGWYISYHPNTIVTNKQTTKPHIFLPQFKKIKIKTQQLNPQNLDSWSISLNLPISLSTSFLSSFSLTKHLPITLSIPSIPTCHAWILRIHEEDKRQQSIYTYKPTDFIFSSSLLCFSLSSPMTKTHSLLSNPYGWPIFLLSLHLPWFYYFLPWSLRIEMWVSALWRGFGNGSSTRDGGGFLEVFERVWWVGKCDSKASGWLNE